MQVKLKNNNSTILFVGSIPGSEDLKNGTHFQGASGNLLRTLCAQAGINLFTASTTYVAKSLPPGGLEDNIFHDPRKHQNPRDFFFKWQEQLIQEIKECNPNIIVAVGDLAHYALTGIWGIKNYRGFITESSLCPGRKVIPIWHPRTLLSDWSLTFETTMDLRKAAYHSTFREHAPDPRMLVVDPQVEQFIEYCNLLITDPTITKIGIDIETVPPYSHISRIGFGHSKNFAMSMKILNGIYPAWDEQTEFKLWDAIARVCTCDKKHIFHNAGYDVTVLYENNGILCTNLEDTMLMMYACWIELPKSLGYSASLLLDVPPWKHTSSENMGLYNAGDVANTIGIYEVLEKKLKELEVETIYERSLRQLPICIMLQMEGITVDPTIQQKLLKQCDDELSKAQQELNILVGYEINCNSPKQLQKLLYVDLKLPAQLKRGTNNVTTDESALSKLYRDTHNPILKLILDVRGWRLLQTNIAGERSPRGRYHTCYNQATTDTARYSSSGSIIFPWGSGNLQNINKFARKMYVANNFYQENGLEESSSTQPIRKWILQADYIQAEAVVVAFLTRDQYLKDILLSGKDLHAYTAASMYGIPVENIHKDSNERKVGKTIRHAVNYSAGPKVVAERLGIQLNEAKRLLDLYLSVNPLLVRWQQSVKQTVQSTKTLTTPLGRKRRFFARDDDGLYRSAYAYIPQSSVGDLLNMAMVEIYEKEPEFLPLLLQLHDAVYIEVEATEDYILRAIKRLRELMLIPLEVNGEIMTIDVDFSVGPTWGDQYTIASYDNDQLFLAGKERPTRFAEARTAILKKLEG